MNLLKIISQIDVGEGELEVSQSQSALADGSTINNLLQLAFFVGAVAAMFVIILAGIQFITSQGEPDKASKARNTIIYAVIGLIICISSFTIVRLVLSNV